MKSVDDVKRFYQEAALRTNRAQDQVVLADALRAGGLASRQSALRAKPNIGRTIMKSRVAKLGTAAAVVVALLISLSHFNGTVVKAVEFEEMTQAMQQVPWLHATVTGFEVPPGGVDEQWAGFEGRIQATKSARGRVVFMREKDHRQWEYDPNSNTITMTYLEAFPVDLPSPATMLTTMHKVWEQEGAQVAVTTGNYRGHKVQVQDLSPSHPPTGKESLALTIYVDSDSKLVYGAEMKSVDAAGQTVGAGAVTYDYPTSGPLSIYDLGLPPDARIVNRTPTNDFHAVWEEYKRHRVEACDQYIAVIVHQEKYPSEIVQKLAVEYRSGQQQRHECYLLSSRDGMIAELGPQHRESLNQSIEPLLAWARRHYENPRSMLSIQLCDGQHDCSVQREDDGRWSRLERGLRARGVDFPLGMAFEGWPTIPSTARIIQDDYAQQNGLICVENLTQGQLLRIGVGLPGRFLYYLDPAQDYLCRRQVMEWRPDAEWQLDKNWLKNVDPKKVPAGDMVVHEMTEVFQAPNGHWYPKVIVQKQTDSREDYRSAPLNVYDVETIYLDLAPAFPEGIFDPKKLPGQ